MLFIFLFSPCVVLFMFIWHLFLLHDFSYATIDMIGRGKSMPRWWTSSCWIDNWFLANIAFFINYLYSSSYNRLKKKWLHWCTKFFVLTRSNYTRLNCQGFYTVILEKGEEILCATSMRYFFDHFLSLIDQIDHEYTCELTSLCFH